MAKKLREFNIRQELELTDFACPSCKRYSIKEFLTSNRGGIVLNICKNCNYCIETGTTVKIVERKIIEVEK